MGARRGRAPEQLEFSSLVDEPPDIAAHAEGLYRIWQQAVEEAGGTVWLAASLEKPHPGVSLKVRHAVDSKGEIQKSTFDMLAHLGPDKNAREVFLHGLCELWGYELPRPSRRLSADEKARILAAGLTDRARRALEREHGLRAGELDP